MKHDQHHLSPRNRGIYLLPNLFTTISLFLGYVAIITAIHQHFSSAAIAILVAMIADALDGRIARLTNTQTAFGAEYDSLSDMIAFGLAPSIVIYQWSLSQLGKIGWILAFLYTASTALRLARFNTQIANADKRYFQGLSCTAAAGVMASMLWLGHTEFNIPPTFISLIVGLIVFVLSACMVSNVRYRSFKEFDSRERIPFIVLLVLVLMVTAIALDPPKLLFIIFFGYACSGPLLTLINRYRLKKIRLRPKKNV